jgi:hypothetical protein
MTFTSTPSPLGQQASLAALLVEAVSGVVAAQRRLDQDALDRVTQYVATLQGEVALPPLWFTFSEVNLQFEMSGNVTRIATSAEGALNGFAANAVRLDCRLVNPTAVSLFGYSAASALKVGLTLSPQDAGGMRPPNLTNPDLASNLPIG